MKRDITVLCASIVALLSGCATNNNTGYHRTCGSDSKNPQGTKITAHSVVMKDIPAGKTFYVATEKDGYMILLKPDDLLRHLSHYQDSERLQEEIKSDLPLSDFTDLNKYRLKDMLEFAENGLSWSQIYSIAEMLENGDATIIDIDNDRTRHGLIQKITVAHVENQYGKWREFCINDDDNFNIGWPIYKVNDEIVD